MRVESWKVKQPKDQLKQENKIKHLTQYFLVAIKIVLLTY